ncbi:hypothetical protein JCM13591A_34620 [Microbacterium xylanilyticum]
MGEGVAIAGGVLVTVGVAAGAVELHPASSSAAAASAATPVARVRIGKGKIMENGIPRWVRESAEREDP